MSADLAISTRDRRCDDMQAVSDLPVHCRVKAEPRKAQGTACAQLETLMADLNITSAMPEGTSAQTGAANILNGQHVHLSQAATSNPVEFQDDRRAAAGLSAYTGSLPEPSTAPAAATPVALIKAGAPPTPSTVNISPSPTPVQPTPPAAQPHGKVPAMSLWDNSPVPSPTTAAPVQCNAPPGNTILLPMVSFEHKEAAPDSTSTSPPTQQASRSEKRERRGSDRGRKGRGRGPASDSVALPSEAELEAAPLLAAAVAATRERPAVMRRWTQEVEGQLLAALERHLQTHTPTDADEAKREALMARMNAMVRRELRQHPHIHVAAYGSFVSKMYSPCCDVDLSLEGEISRGPGDPPIPLWEASRYTKSSLLRDVMRGLKRERMSAGYVETILGARVPILKFVERLSELECDMSVASGGANFKCQVLRQLATIDARFTALTRLVKAWARSWDLNDASQATFNSFALTLMVAFHLQQRQPPILPPLCQLFGLVPNAAEARPLHDHRQPDFGLLEGVEVQAAAFVAQGFGADNKESLLDLLQSFFAECATVLEHWLEYPACRAQRMSSWRGEWYVRPWRTDSYLVSIEDPFDLTDNCGRTVAPATGPTIVQSFQQAAATLAGVRRPAEVQAAMQLLFKQGSRPDIAAPRPWPTRGDRSRDRWPPGARSAQHAAAKPAPPGALPPATPSAHPAPAQVHHMSARMQSGDRPSYGEFIASLSHPVQADASPQQQHAGCSLPDTLDEGPPGLPYAPSLSQAVRTLHSHPHHPQPSSPHSQPQPQVQPPNPHLSSAHSAPQQQQQQRPHGAFAGHQDKGKALLQMLQRNSVEGGGTAAPQPAGDRMGSASGLNGGNVAGDGLPAAAADPERASSHRQRRGRGRHAGSGGGGGGREAAVPDAAAHAAAAAILGPGAQLVLTAVPRRAAQPVQSSGKVLEVPRSRPHSQPGTPTDPSAVPSAGAASQAAAAASGQQSAEERATAGAGRRKVFRRGRGCGKAAVGTEGRQPVQG